MSTPPHDRDDGIVVRVATAADREAIVSLSVDAHGAVEESGVRHFLDTRPVDRWTVAVTPGGEVVSTMTLLSHTLVLDGLDIPLGQIEYVATARDHRRRGLLQPQIDWHHAVSSARGDLVQLINGIPYLYRRFGYGYGFSYPAQYRLTEPGAVDPDVVVRPATPVDEPDLRRLHERACGRADVTLPWTADTWGALLGDAPRWKDHVLTAVRDGRVVAWAVLYSYPPDDWLLVHGAADDTAAAVALLADARTRSGSGRLVVLDRPGDAFGAAVHQTAARIDAFHAQYARVPDPVSLLRHLRPVLDRRLARSAFSDHRGRVVIGLYERSIVLEIAGGSVTAVTDGPVIEDPPDTGDIGVAPDWFPALVLGRFEPAELARRADDVLFGAHLPIIEALFPRRSADIGDII